MKIAAAMVVLALGLAQARAATVQINIQGMQFGPGNQPVTVNAGDTVRWTNFDSVTHTVTSGANRVANGTFDNFLLNGQSFSHTFSEAGTFPYFCRPHASMVSSIIVRAVGPPSRAFGGASDNAVAAARHGGDRLAAVAAGTRLYLVDAASTALSDRPNWAGGKELSGTVTGRPAFGGAAGQLLVAVGTSSGRALLFDAVSGATLGDVTVPGASLPESPAIVPRDGDVDVYWPAQTGSGPALVRMRGNDIVSTTSLGAAGATVRSSPAVYNGSLVVGTSAGARVFRINPDSGVLTPQGDAAAPQEDFGTSPVITSRGEALIGSTGGRVHKINLATGTGDGAPLSLPAAAAPLSSPFYRGSTDEAFFGGANGSIYRVRANAIGTDSELTDTMAFGTGSVSAPVVVGESILAADSTGKYGVVGATASTALGSAVGRAIAVTGQIPGADVALINTVNGTLWAVPVS